MKRDLLPVHIAIAADSGILPIVEEAIESQSHCKLVVAANNGKTLLERLSGLRSRPDGIFLSIEMPIMDGVATLRELFDVYPGIRVIGIVSARDKVADLQQMLSYGCHLYVSERQLPELKYSFSCIEWDKYLYPDPYESRRKPLDCLECLISITPLDARLLRLLSRGKSKKFIVATMGIGGEKDFDEYLGLLINKLHGLGLMEEGIQRGVLPRKEYRSYLFLSNQGIDKDHVLLWVEDIRYIKTADNYCLLYYDKDKYYTLLLPLEVLMEELDPGKFCQAHRQYGVNMGYIKTMSQKYTIVKLRDGTEVKLGEEYKEEFIRRYILSKKKKS